MTLQVGTIGSPALLGGDYADRLALMAQIDAAPIDHLFIADHVSFHNGLGMDGIVNAATLAALSPDIRIFIGVYLLALRHPVPVARQLSSLSISAPGRITLGVGIGGEDRHEMEVCGVDPSTRGRRTNECLAALRDLLSGTPASYDCEFFSFEDALIKPAPNPAIPVMIGGRSEAALRRTANHGDGWLAVWCSPRRFTDATAQVADMAGAAGREPAWQHGLQIWVGCDDDENAARERIATEMQQFYHTPFEAFEKYSPYGRPERIAEFLAPYVEAGAEVLNIKPCAADDEAAIAAVGEVAAILKKAFG